MSQLDTYTSFDAIALAEGVANGDFSPRQLLDEAMARLDAHNATLNAVTVSMFDQARAAIDNGLPEGPFRGVPFLLKDLGVFYTGVRTTNGSRMFSDYVADHDSELVARYKRAGLVIFGKSASPEFGLTTSTDSLLFGPTRNPWRHTHMAGGSSGGAAAAVAIGILPAAHASDGGGSIRVPASCCGLFGLKPTRARNPAGPDLGEGWAGMSTGHVITRSVRDSAALLDVTSGPDVGDPYWAPPPARPFLDEVDTEPGKLRIAYTAQAFNGVPTHADCVSAMEDAVALCGTLGHHVEEAKLTIDVPQLREATRIIIGANTRCTLEQRAAALGRPLQPDDVEPRTYTMVTGAQKVSASDYARAIRTLHAIGRQVGRFVQPYDVLLSPTMATPPLELEALSPENPDNRQYLQNLMLTVGYTQLFNVAGNPAMSVPLFWNADGLPIGIQFAGKFGDEATLFRLAGQLEQARPWANRRPL